MQNKILLLSLLAFFGSNALAQEIEHSWLETSQLKVRVNADGRLFCDDEKGAFLVPQGDSMVSLVRGSGIWFGGLDPGGNLNISVQGFDPLKTDFKAGLRGIPKSAKVWKVTREEIEAHQKDYLDNWVVDNPIPSIFGWPARGNNFFNQYNDFAWPDSVPKFPYYNEGDGRYDPNRGDFPYLNIRYLDTEWQVPTEMACFVFHTDTPQPLSNCTRPFTVQVWGQVFVYDCPENDLLSRSVFVHYYWQNEGGTPFDSSSVSVLNDFDIGDPQDDYHGFLPINKIYYAYNADSMDNTWGSHPPIMLVKDLFSPSRYEYNEYSNSFEGNYSPATMMPYGNRDTISPIAMTEATNSYQFYNYMTGTWRDGTPLTGIGRGYNPGNPDAPMVEDAFPGYPDVPGVWSELNAQNPAGNRQALLNHKIGRSIPKLVNQMTLQYTYVPWEPGTFKDRIQVWETEELSLLDHIYCCIDFFNNPLQPIGCEFGPGYFTKPEPWTVFPNPAHDVIKVWHPGIYLRKMLLFNALGTVLGVGEYQGEYSEISVRNLPTGMYFLQIEDEAGSHKTVKVMVAHGGE